MRQLVNPHAHSDYSLDGAAKVQQIVAYTKELGATHVSLTEHGNLNSAAELYKEAKAQGLKPILGIELYVEPPFLEELRVMIANELEAKGKLIDVSDSKKQELIEKELKKEYVHLTVHFKDEWAYNYFTSLTAKMEKRAIVKFGERKPIATIEELAGAKGHITICSGCLVGMVNKFLLPRRITKITRPDLAERAYQLLREVAGPDHFFAEIMPHELKETWQPPTKNSPGRAVPHECTADFPDGDLQKRANQFILHLANKYNDPVLVSLDSHFATPNQKIVQDARLGNGQEQWKFLNSYHIMTSEEAFRVLQRQLNIDRKTMEKWIDNSYRWASLFDGFKMTTAADRWVLRALPENYQAELIAAIQKFGRMDWSNPAMVERLKYEIDVLANNGKLNLLSYFFTVNDIANFCRENDILINVRGSAGGSLLLYVLGVSAINPLKHNLSFERFLTLGRIKANTLPDVDMDVANQGRVMNYLQDKYGDAFCRISVDVGLKLKSAIKDAERAILGKVRPETERLCVALPKPVQGLSEDAFVFGYTDEDGVEHKGIIETYPPLKKYVEFNKEIWSVVEEMLGIIRQKSQHACGVVIADQPIQNYIPITYIGDTRVTGFSPKSLEYVGLIKYDILGLNTLRDIEQALKLIKQEYGLQLDPFNLPYDKNVFADLASGDTVTVFQFDTDTVRPYLQAIKPQTIDGLAAVTALCRPGTLDAPSGIKDDKGRELSLAELYIFRATGKQPIQYVHKDLEPILAETYGIQLYQEQTLQIFRDIAGYTFEQAEAVRRGIGKKDAAVLTVCMADLKSAGLKRGWTVDQVDLLVEQIMASSRYAFNKSHAVSYAYVAYACAYLKRHYPIEWWTAILMHASNEDIKKFYSHCHHMIELPNINQSSDQFMIVKSESGKKSILAPLHLIDGVGPAAVSEIVRKRPFKDFSDFYDKIDKSAVNKKVIERLLLSGFLDPLFPSDFTLTDKINTVLQKRRASGFKDDANDWSKPIALTAFQREVQRRRILNVWCADWTELFAKEFERQKQQKNLTPNDNKNISTCVWDLKREGPIWSIKSTLSEDSIRKFMPSKLPWNRGIMLLNAQQVRDNVARGQEQTFAFMGYVLKESDFKYTKNQEEYTARKYEVEIGDSVYEIVKFPPFGMTHHGIEESIEDEVRLFVVKGQYSLARNSYQMYLQCFVDIPI